MNFSLGVPLLFRTQFCASLSQKAFFTNDIAVLLYELAVPPLNEAALVPALVPCFCHYCRTKSLSCRGNGTAAIYLMIGSSWILLNKLF